MVKPWHIQLEIKIELQHVYFVTRTTLTCVYWSGYFKKLSTSTFGFWPTIHTCISGIAEDSSIIFAYFSLCNRDFLV